MYIWLNLKVLSSVFDVDLDIHKKNEAVGIDGSGYGGIVPIKIGYSLTILRNIFELWRVIRRI